MSDKEKVVSAPKVDNGLAAKVRKLDEKIERMQANWRKFVKVHVGGSSKVGSSRFGIIGILALISVISAYAATVIVDSKVIGTASWALTEDGTDMTLTVDKIVTDSITVPSVILDGYTPVLSESATASSMIQSGTLLVADVSTFTNTFDPVYSAAPVVTCSYVGDSGDVQPVYVLSVASNAVVVKAAVTNVSVSFIAIGLK